VTLPDGTVVDRDDGPRPGVTLDAVAALKPVFRPDGTVTAANCCPLNDGAAAVVVMSDRKARDLGITPLARIVSTGSPRCRRRSWGLARWRPHGRRCTG
jgi:acetyl-CoA C-acetyltransferase